MPCSCVVQKQWADIRDKVGGLLQVRYANYLQVIEQSGDDE